MTAAPTFAENIMSFAVPYGLALQGLKQARLQTNLLPHEVRLERLVRGKKPWTVAAAACLLFALLMLTFARAVEKNAVENKDIKASTIQLKAEWMKQLNNDAKFKKQEENLNISKKNLNQIGAGVNERFNWQALHEYVNFAMPQPNGERLVVEAKRGERLDRVKEALWDKNPKRKTHFKGGKSSS